MPEEVSLQNRLKAVRLIAIANELLAFARELELSTTYGQPSAFSFESDTCIDPQQGAALGETVDLPIWGELARQLYRNRRRRNDVFQSEELFGEPAWDILLDLFVAAKERRRVSVSSACIAAAVPSTTALRWITVLEKSGLIQRRPDPEDARRIYVALSATGYSKMLEYLSKASFPIYPLDHEKGRS